MVVFLPNFKLKIENYEIEGYKRSFSAGNSIDNVL